MLFSITMLTPVIASWLAADETIWIFVSAFLITLFSGAFLWLPVRSYHKELRLRDGFVVVVMFWVVLSIDEKETLVGIKSFDVPIPLTSSPLKLPEVALYKETERKGVAKIAATAYATADGKLIDSSDPAFGYSHKRKYNILLFFSWRSNDLPKEKNDELIDQLRDEW